MKAPRTRSERMLEQMAHAVVPVQDPNRQSALEARIVPRIEELHAQVMLQARQRRSRKRWMVVAAACVPLGVWGAWYSARLAEWHGVARPLEAPALAWLEESSGGTTVDGRVATRGAVLHAGQALSTHDDGRLALRFDHDATVTLDPAGRVVLAGAFGGDARDEGVTLWHGFVSVHVPHLEPGRHFSVHTPDSVVQVHGTRFTVEVSGEPPVTRVRVTEGRVSVRHSGTDAFVDAGSSWSSNAADRAASAVTNTVQSAANPVTTATLAVKAAAPAISVSREDTLGAQNSTFERAMQSRRRDDRAAIALFDQLLGKYPRSPLSETAEVERFRALARLGRRSDAAAGARAYLAQHPDGFAQAEARELAFGEATPERP